VITIPDRLWELMYDEFKRAKRNVERVAYLDGVALDDGGIATTLVIPDAQLAVGWYDVPTGAMSQAGAHFRAFKLVRLAQVHTHPKEWVEHSDRDSEKAYSQELGTVSIVVPFHGKHRPAPQECGVNVRDADGWRLVDATEARSIVRLVPTFLDFRR